MCQPCSARAVVAGVAEEIGVPGITPHSLRRTFATLARDSGQPDRDIMASGGWHSPQMLDYYDMGRRAARSGAPEALERFLGEQN